MSLLKQLQEDMRASMKARMPVRTSIIKLVVSEASRLEASPGRKSDVTDPEIHKIMTKLVEGNAETLKSLKADDPRRPVLEEENAILEDFLPTILTLDQVRQTIRQMSEQIHAARSVGEATGIVMKHFKKTGEAFNGSDVKRAVREVMESTLA
jgi:uncharacterized protein YqeY